MTSYQGGTISADTVSNIATKARIVCLLKQGERLIARMDDGFEHPVKAVVSGDRVSVGCVRTSVSALELLMDQIRADKRLQDKNIMAINKRMSRRKRASN